MNILIADDESDLAEMLGETLRGDGHQVDIAFDGKKAFEYLQSKSYNIAILDHNMPEFTGLELTKYIREQHFPTKVVLISGYPIFREFFAKSRMLVLNEEIELTMVSPKAAVLKV